MKTFVCDGKGPRAEVGPAWLTSCISDNSVDNRVARQVSNFAQTAAVNRRKIPSRSVALFHLLKDEESHDMKKTHYPAFHGEYWIYLFAAFTIVGVGMLMSIVDGPIKFSSWF